MTTTLSYYKHPKGDASDLFNSYLGVVYTLDVLRLVPHFELGMTHSIVIDDHHHCGLNFYVEFDLTYLINWERSISMLFRYEKTIYGHDLFKSYYLIGFRYNFIFESE